MIIDSSQSCTGQAAPCGQILVVFIFMSIYNLAHDGQAVNVSFTNECMLIFLKLLSYPTWMGSTIHQPYVRHCRRHSISFYLHILQKKKLRLGKVKEFAEGHELIAIKATFKPRFVFKPHFYFNCPIFPSKSRATCYMWMTSRDSEHSGMRQYLGWWTCSRWSLP